MTKCVDVDAAIAAVIVMASLFSFVLQSTPNVEILCKFAYCALLCNNQGRAGK